MEDEEGNQLLYTWNVMLRHQLCSFSLYLSSQTCGLFSQEVMVCQISPLLNIEDIFLAGLGLKSSLMNQAFALDVLEKSTGPLSRLKFLGLDICCSRMPFYIPEEKMQRFLDFIEELLSQRSVKLRDLVKNFRTSSIILQSFEWRHEF